MVGGLLAHLVAGLLATSSGLFALGYALTDHETPYQEFLLSAGRVTVWVAIFYVILGFGLYVAGLRRKNSGQVQTGNPSSRAGWLLQLVGATFAVASSAFAAAAAKRGPFGDSRDLGYIFLGAATVGILAGMAVQGWLWRTGRLSPKSP